MRTLGIVSIVLALSATSFAQTPAGEVSAGWSYLNSRDLSSDDFDPLSLASMPLGFHFGGGARVTDSVGIVGDFGWNRKRESLGNEFGTLEAEVSFTTFSGGPRLYFGERVTGFVHVLVGGVRANVDASVDGLGFDEGLSESQTELLIQPGAGVDVRVGESFAVRLQGDYQWINAEDADGNLRFVVAGVFYLGER